MTEPTESPRRAMGSWIALGVGGLAFLGALGFALTRDGGLGGDGAATPTSAESAADPMAALEARTRAEPDNADAWVQLGQAKFDGNDFAGANHKHISHCQICCRNTFFNAAYKP